MEAINATKTPFLSLFPIRYEEYTNEDPIKLDATRLITLFLFRNPMVPPMNNKIPIIKLNKSIFFFYLWRGVLFIKKLWKIRKYLFFLGLFLIILWQPILDLPFELVIGENNWICHLFTSYRRGHRLGKPFNNCLSFITLSRIDFLDKKIKKKNSWY